ncbi:MAG: hypothetical protein ACLTOZ_13830 [[Clostridium] leptum]
MTSDQFSWAASATGSYILVRSLGTQIEICGDGLQGISKTNRSGAHCQTALAEADFRIRATPFM